jgi:hypothetical protein
MPYFYFDLVVGEEFKDQGGMILEDTQIAFEKADSLASELYIVRRELRFALFASLMARTRNSIAHRLIPPRVGNSTPQRVILFAYVGNATEAKENSGTSSPSNPRA